MRELQDIIPDDPDQPYDIKQIIECVVDERYFLKSCARLCLQHRNRFLRLGGQSVGIVANQPNYLAGVLDINASDKAARFIRFCDSFNIPIVTFVDVPVFFPVTHKRVTVLSVTVQKWFMLTLKRLFLKSL